MIKLKQMLLIRSFWLRLESSLSLSLHNAKLVTKLMYPNFSRKEEARLIEFSCARIHK